MADGPNDFRDPKVSDNKNATKKDSGGGIGKWIAMIVGAILLLLVLAWLFGLFADDEVETTTTVDPVENEAVVDENAAEIESD